jgi:hypothetical protein
VYDDMIFLAGAVYFVLVFAVGFALGVIRVVLVVPALGERWAELLETPLMIAASYLAARWTVRRFGVPVDRIAQRLGLGLIGLALLLGAEIGVVLRLRGLSISEYVAGRDPVSGGVYVLALLVFSVMPVFAGRSGAEGVRAS